jgi:hypothetical protein
MDPTASERDALLFAQQADQVLAQLRERLAPADYQLQPCHDLDNNRTV